MTAYNLSQLFSGTDGDDFAADGHIGHDSEAAIHGHGAAQKANPSAQLMQHGIAQHGAKAQREERDPQGQENTEQKTRQIEGADPQTQRKYAPQNQRQTDGAVGARQIEQFVAAQKDQRRKPPPERAIADESRGAEGVAGLKFHDAGYDLGGTAERQC